MDSPFYKERFRQAGLTPSDIQTLDDLKKIPFTTKQDLRETYPFGMAAVPLDQCVRLHSSSGTTGNPTVILHTQKDLEEWANAVARCLWMVGCRPEDVFQNTSGYGKRPPRSSPPTASASSRRRTSPGCCKGPASSAHSGA